jgi:dTDP-4-dehydrorhamnose reductase
MRIIILGITGMLGHTLFRDLAKNGFDVFGSVRNIKPVERFFSADTRDRLIDAVDAYNFPSVVKAVDTIGPDVIINCIGLIRQRPEGQAPLPCIEINARFPHLLFALCRERNIRLIHYSTDCVFDGKKGSPYTEHDLPSARDIYGLTKYLGELCEAPALTIRTSIIGPELRGKMGLLEWFLSQEDRVNGYTRAIFTGLPTCEHSRIVREYILANPRVCGLYHVAAEPISKFDLLRLIAREYRKNLEIRPDDSVQEDKRLSADAFVAAVGYRPPPWPDLVRNMRESL